MLVWPVGGAGGAGGGAGWRCYARVYAVMTLADAGCLVAAIVALCRGSASLAFTALAAGKHAGKHAGKPRLWPRMHLRTPTGLALELLVKARPFVCRLHYEACCFAAHFGLAQLALAQQPLAHLPAAPYAVHPAEQLDEHCHPYRLPTRVDQQ